MCRTGTCTGMVSGVSTGRHGASGAEGISSGPVHDFEGGVAIL
jgi:hypothetical protein